MLNRFNATRFFIGSEPLGEASVTFAGNRATLCSQFIHYEASERGNLDGSFAPRRRRRQDFALSEGKQGA